MSKRPYFLKRVKNIICIVTSSALAISFVLMPTLSVKAASGLVITESGGATTLNEGGNSDISYGYTFTMGGTANDALQKIAVDSEGAVYSGGLFTSTADIDPTRGVQNEVSPGGTNPSYSSSITGAGGRQIYLNKISKSGLLEYAYNIGNSSSEYLSDIVVDSNGNLYAVGFFSGTVDFDPTSGTDEKTASGSTNSFFLKINSNGSYGFTMVSQTGITFYGLAKDSSDNVYISGNFSGSDINLNITGSGANDLKTSGAAEDAFVIKINSNGSYGSSYVFSGDGSAIAYELDIDASNNIYVGGYFSGEIDFDPTAGSDVYTSTDSDFDAFIVKINSNGTYGFGNILSGDDNEFIYTVKVDLVGDIYIGGYFQDTIDWDNDSVIDDTANAVEKAFIAKIDPSGSFIFFYALEGTPNVLEPTQLVGSCQVKDITIDQYNNVYYSGVSSSIDQADFNITGAGGADVRVLQPSTFSAFFTKLGSDGSYGYTYLIDEAAESEYASIGVTSDDIIYVGGHYESTIDLDPTSSTDNKASAGSFDAFITMFVPEDVYMVRLDSEPTSNVNVSIAPNNDVSVSPTSMVFGPSNWDVDRFVFINAVDDTWDESGAHLGFVLHSSSSSDINFNGSSTLYVDVSDNGDDVDPIEILISESGGSTLVSESGAVDTCSIVLNKQPVYDVDITITPDAQLDTDSYGITFTPFNWSTPQVITVSAVDDGDTEVNHTGTITHTSSSADPLFDSLIISDVVADIVDNEGIQVLVSNLSIGATEGGAGGSYTISLSDEPTGDVVITITPDSQVTASEASITFTNSNWSTPQTIDVLAVNDSVVEGNHIGVINHSSSSTDINYDGLLVAPVSVDITDNDVAGVTIVQSGGSTTVSESGTTDTYTVVLDSQPSSNVVISINVDSQVTVLPTSLTFTSANWDTPQTVTVSAVNDTVVEGNHSGTITHTAASSDSNYDGVSIANVSANILDNDSSAPSGGGGGGGSSPSPAPSTDNGLVDVAPSSGGTTVLNVSGTGYMTVNVLPGSVSSSTSVNISTSVALQEIISDYFALGGIVYNLTATSSSGQISSFSNPIDIIIGYNPSLLPIGIGEGEIKLYQFDASSGEWSLVEGYVLDISNDKVILNTRLIASKYAILYPSRSGQGTIPGDGQEELIVADKNPSSYSYEYISQSVYPQLKRGGATVLTLRIKNTGKATWYNRGANSTKVGTSRQNDRVSIFSNNLWISPNRPASMSESKVEPGGIATFSINIVAPLDRQGKFREYFTPVVDGITWMNDIGIYWDITIVEGVAVPLLSAEYVNQSPYLTINKGESANLWVEYKNVGTADWDKGGPNPLRLGTSNEMDRESSFAEGSWISANRAAVMDKDKVAPGGTARFNFTIKAPNVAGTFREYFRPVVEGISWLEDFGLYWDITVK